MPHELIETKTTEEVEQTVHGEATIEVFECAACGQTYPLDDASYHFVGTVDEIETHWSHCDKVRFDNDVEALCYCPTCDHRDAAPTTRSSDASSWWSRLRDTLPSALFPAFLVILLFALVFAVSTLIVATAV